MSPVLRAGIDTLAFMRMTSTSSPSSLKKPRLEATPAVRKETSNAEIDSRTLSAACKGDATRNTAQVNNQNRLISKSTTPFQDQSLLSLAARLNSYTTSLLLIYCCQIDNPYAV